jgi:hypothetical protein
MKRSIIVLTTTLIALLPLSACSTQGGVCTGDACSYSISGKPTLEIGLGGPEQELAVEAIEQGAVTMSSRGEQASLKAGEVGTVGGLAVRVVTVDGNNAKIEVRRG